jgi:phosphoglycolate phosphatase-like HAD superfamily hydrolase
LSSRPIAFDLDGTLVDAAPRQIAAAQAASRSVAGFELDGAHFWELKRQGLTTLDALRRIGFEEPLASSVAAEWRHHVEDPMWLDLDRPLPGALSVVERVLSARRPVLVLTARTSPTGAAHVLDSIGLAGRVELRVVSPSATVQQKEAALVDSAALGYIGDAETDAAAASGAAVPFVAVSTGQRSAAFLLARECPVASTLPEAWDLLISLMGPAADAI